ncbi:MAG: aldo/keto reductase [Deltaproteobacteria bacterium]|nr:MAG: aldo/keto reductase [Deltaproteobacteria bacterium]
MSDVDLLSGRATAEGTRRYAARFEHLPEHFRSPDRLYLSSLALGTRRGRPGGVDDLQYRTAVLELVQCGVNVVNTALFDRFQTSERCVGAALGRAIASGLVRRDEVVAVTRGGYLTPDAERARTRDEVRRHLHETYVASGLVDPARVVNGLYSLEPRLLLHQIERSRANLGLATLDVYCIQEPELHLLALGPSAFRRQLGEAFETLERAVSEGRIAAYGLCTWEGLLLPHTERGHLSVLDLFELALDVAGGDHHLRAIQLPFGLATEEARGLESQLGMQGRAASVLEVLRDTGTFVMGSAPLLGGRVLGHVPEAVRDAFPNLTTDAQRCLQFARSTPGITSAVVGMRDERHVRENLELLRTPPAAPETLEAIFAGSTADALERAG